MRTLVWAAALCVAALAVASASSAGPPAQDCDRLAASPDDPQRAAEGVAFKAIDHRSAIASCAEAVRSYPATPRFRYQLGRAYRAVGRQDTGLLHIHDAAEAGHVHAQTVLAAAFASGDGVPRDDAEAFLWYSRAAARGGRAAQAGLAAMYFTGRGTAPDPAMARRWYAAAAEQGHLAAQVIVGFMYNNGHGGAGDPAKAAHWLGKAAARGAAEAQFGLAALYLGGSGVKRDFVRSHMWMNLAAETFPPGPKRDAALAFRDALARAMSTAQIDEARRLAEHWAPAEGKRP